MTVEKAKQFLIDHPGYLKWGADRLSDKLGLSRALITDLKAVVRIETAVSNDSRSTNEGGDPPVDGTAYDQYLAVNGISPDDVVSVKYWQNMGGEQRFSVVTKEDNELSQAQMEEAIFSLFESYSPPVYVTPVPVVEDKCAIINMYDAHIDKVVLAGEVYDESTDLSLEERYQELEDRFDEVLAGVAMHRPETIFFPVGNDFFNTNGPGQGTKRGTPQRTIAPHEEVFLRGAQFYMDCVVKLLQVCHNVEVIVIRGNHDADPVFYLGVAMMMGLAKEDRVKVHMSRHARKYFEYGIWGFGFGHGDNEKRNMDRMPLWFAQEAKPIWYRTKFHEMFLGDIHHREEYKFRSSYDGVGMSAHFLRSTNGVDQWHSDSGWIGIPKEISSTIFNRTSGRKNSVNVSW